ncbi:MAG: acyl carrier protein [Niastella sp. SCN 39-18]|nr:acyl carrier protein [Sphingobacteriales bacterium]ODT50085.1 MAG: acyl carrier protein [Niastella sp. SCN 39-18]OJW07150.1 MAG: acyl carrier protein [Sphingobacteriales bacterium 39-19]
MDKIISIINRVLENNNKSYSGTITETTSLRNDIGFDSLDLAELTVNIEEEYGVDIFENGFVETVGDIMKKTSK